MKIIHRISKQTSPERLTASLKWCISIKLDPLNIFYCEIDESDERWPAIQQWMDRQGIIDTIRTDFSKEEIASAT